MNVRKMICEKARRNQVDTSVSLWDVQMGWKCFFELLVIINNLSHLCKGINFLKQKIWNQ